MAIASPDKKPTRPADGNPASPAASADKPPDLWTLLHYWAWKRFGLAGVIVLACLGIWWQWDHVIKLPGVAPVVARMTEKALPKAVPGKFNIAIAHLDGDDRHETERLIRESLAEFPSVAVLSFDRLIAPNQGDSDKDERVGHERARALLKATGADVLIWGVILRQGGRSVPKLYWTPSRDVTQTLLAGRYQTTEDLSLPNIFWQDLTHVLGLLVATNEAEFAAQEGQYNADKLEPFIERVRGLLRSSKADQWDAATRANVLTILGSALTTYGDQSGRNEPLREAIAVHREALKARSRERAPLSWAATQHDLGAALVTLGQREADVTRLNEGVAAYRDALQERTRDKVPLSWAATQNNLGNALRLVGQRDPDPASLNEAVAAYHEALQERTRDKVPLAWAATQNNLGVALRILGEREPDSVRLNEAVSAFHAALEERTRDKVPLSWATTQNNLGVTLGILAERGSDPARFDEAAAALRGALQERTREKVPLDWATTQNNLGNVLRMQGERESNPIRLNDAVVAFHEALQERTRDKVPLDWAVTQNNLGNALRALGKREPGTARLEEAAGAYESALLVLRPARAEYYTELTERNLQRVQKEIAERKRAKSNVGKQSR